MAKKQDTTQNIKELYIEGFEVIKIAQILNKTIGTIQQYKSQDKKNGNDWDELRTKKIKSIFDNKENDIHSVFIDQMHQAIKSINSDKSLKPLEKTSALAQIADSYSKIIKIAYKVNPEKYIYTIIDAHISLLIESVQEKESYELYNELLIILKDDSYNEKLKKIKDKYIEEILSKRLKDV